MAGAFRDIFLFKDYFRMRSLFLLVTLISLLVYLSQLFSLINSYPPSFFGLPSVTNFLGGTVFGIGMVMAGGCTIGTLYKMGSGNLVSAFAFLGILFGSILFAIFYPMSLSFTQAVTLSRKTISLEQIAGTAVIPLLLLLLVSVFLFYKWYRERKWTQKAYARGYLDPWKAAVLMAIVVSLSFITSGRPLSVTKGYAKLSAYLGGQSLFHSMSGLRFYKEDSLRLLDGTIMRGGTGINIDAITITQIPLITGIILGAFFSSVRLKEFKINSLPPGKQIFSALIGGILMAVGSLMASGCNLWHIIGGLPVFALQSILFVSGLIPGAYIGSHIIKRIIIR